MILAGRVKSGIHSFSYWMEKLHGYYAAKTGMDLYPGTLNVELPSPFILPPGVIRLEKEEYGGRVSVSMLPCEVFGRKAFIIRTDQNAAGLGDHPLHIVEIATDVKLRDAYHLSDGDLVEIVIGEPVP